MFKNFWYALEFSKVVDGKRPVEMPCLGQDVVMHRDPSGRVRAWNKARTGKAEFPATDRYGFVWVFLGDPDLPASAMPPIPEWPEWDDPAYGGHAATGEFLWNAGAERILENGVDIAHAPFVHAGQFGNPNKPEVPEHTVIETEYTAETTVTLYPPGSKGLWGKFKNRNVNLDDRPGVTTNTCWMMPNIIRLKVNIPIGVLCLYDTNIPLAKDKTLTKFVVLRTFLTGTWADKNAVKRTMPIFVNDAAVVEHQRPELLPYDLSAELHIRSDQMALAYRRRRQELLDGGWGYDWKTPLPGMDPSRLPEIGARSLAA
jgi:phenylpropionate dioxygenase-like ring-hydroxylating dioxygenase large terminal subunit